MVSLLFLQQSGPGSVGAVAVEPVAVGEAGLGAVRCAASNSKKRTFNSSAG